MSDKEKVRGIGIERENATLILKEAGSFQGILPKKIKKMTIFTIMPVLTRIRCEPLESDGCMYGGSHDKRVLTEQAKNSRLKTTTTTASLQHIRDGPKLEVS